MENTISSKQLVVICFILGIGQKLTMLPSLLISHAARGALITSLVQLCIELAVLFMTLTALKYVRLPKEHGKFFIVLKKAAAVLFFLWSLMKLILIMGELRLFYGFSVFANIYWPVFFIPPLALTMFIGKGCGRALGRLSEILFPVIVLSLALLILMASTGKIDIMNIFPMKDNLKGLDGAQKFFLWYCDYPLLLCFLGKTQIKKHTVAFSMLSGAIAALAVMVFMVLLTASYADLATQLEYGQNLSNMTQYVGSYNFGKLDLVIFCIWSVVIFVKAGFFCFTAVRSLGTVTKKNNFGVLAFITVALVYIVLMYVIGTTNKLFLYATSPLRFFAAAVQFLSPAAVLITGFIMNRKNAKKGALYESK